MNKENNEVTANSLKSILWSTLQDLKDRKIKPDMANAVTKGVNAITSVVKLEIETAKALNMNTASLTSFVNSQGVQPKNYLSTEEQEKQALEGQDVQAN